MASRKEGYGQAAAAARSGFSERTGRRIGTDPVLPSQPSFQAPLLDLREGHLVHTGGARIGASQPIGVVQDVLATHLVVEHVEAESRLRLRLTIELSLKGPDLTWCCQAHRQSPFPHHLRKRTRSQGPLLRRHYPASTLQ